MELRLAVKLWGVHRRIATLTDRESSAAKRETDCRLRFLTDKTPLSITPAEMYVSMAFFGGYNQTCDVRVMTVRGKSSPTVRQLWVRPTNWGGGSFLPRACEAPQKSTVDSTWLVRSQVLPSFLWLPASFNSSSRPRNEHEWNPCRIFKTIGASRWRRMGLCEYRRKEMLHTSYSR
jgi:hypothetical protein